MDQQTQQHESQTIFVLRPNKRYLIHLATGALVFIALCISWFLNGAGYSGFMRALTILIGFIIGFAAFLRFRLSPSFIQIEGETINFHMFFRQIKTYKLSEITRVDYSVWTSILISRAGWIRIGPADTRIFISDLFFENLGAFLNLLETKVIGIVVNRKLIKKYFFS